MSFRITTSHGQHKYYSELQVTVFPKSNNTNGNVKEKKKKI